MYTESMVKSFQNVYMVDWDDKIETRNGYRDVCETLYIYIKLLLVMQIQNQVKSLHRLSIIITISKI